MIKKIEASAMPIIKKSVNGADASLRGAFAYGDIINFTVEAPRRLGASAVVLRLCADGGEDQDFPFSFQQTDLGVDEYV